MGTRPRTFVIRRAEQLAALSSPMRWRLVEAFSAHGRCSVRELGARVGRQPESLYYHVRALMNVGLVVPDSTQRISRRSEVVYRLVAPRLTVDRKQRSRPYREALSRSCEAFLRLTARDHRAAVQSGDFTIDGPFRSLMVRRYCARFDRNELARLNRLLDRVSDFFDKRLPGDGPETYAVTVVLTRLGGRRASLASQS